MFFNVHITVYLYIVFITTFTFRMLIQLCLDIKQISINTTMDGNPNKMCTLVTISKVSFYRAITTFPVGGVRGFLERLFLFLIVHRLMEDLTTTVV